jgi:hypothetical protein
LGLVDEGHDGDVVLRAAAGRHDAVAVVVGGLVGG